MLHLGRTVGADKRGLHVSSTGDIKEIDALGVPPEGAKIACGGVLADTKAVIRPSAGRLRKQEKENL